MAGFDIQHLMRQARKLEKAMEEARAKLGEISVEAEAAGGLVKVRMDGRCSVQRVEIDPKALEAGDKAMLEDLVAAAVNAAADKARAAAEESMQKATGGVKMPGLPY
jgi:DNA-binding YbaB/EbfC family protein